MTNSTPSNMLNINLHLSAPGGVHKSVHGSVTENGLEMETTKCLSVGKWTTNHVRVLYSSESKPTIVMYNNNMDISHGYI